MREPVGLERGGATERVVEALTTHQSGLSVSTKEAVA
jgi:hypothetical protein